MTGIILTTTNIHMTMTMIITAMMGMSMASIARPIAATSKTTAITTTTTIIIITTPTATTTTSAPSA